MPVVGQVVRLAGEHQMDAVTAVSGSGPGYVFHLIEAMAAAGVAEGLPADLAMPLARATVAGQANWRIFARNGGAIAHQRDIARRHHGGGAGGADGPGNRLSRA